jgi:hypothetical protein
MNLEEKIQTSEIKDEKSDKINSIKNTVIGFIGAGIGGIAGYNLGGFIINSINTQEDVERGIAAILTAGGTILGYKTKGMINKLMGKSKKTKARAKTLAAISKDEEFQERQGIKQGQAGKIRKTLKYLLTIPFGGALGYVPGMIADAPLCVYFGKHYDWNSITFTGEIAGPLVGAYALTEMAGKKQYKRLATTAAALGAASAGFFLINELNLDIYDSLNDMWYALGIEAGLATVGAVLGNQVYKRIKKYKDEK